MVRPGVTTRKPRREACAAGTAHRVDRLPGDQHRHDGGLAGAGGQLQGETQQFGIGVSVGIGQMVEESLAALGLGCDLGQPDGRFHRLDLAEERANVAELVMPPVLEQACRLWRNLPLGGIRQGPPLVHVLTQLVDDRGGVVLLLGVERPFLRRRPSSAGLVIPCVFWAWGSA